MKTYTQTRSGAAKDEIVSNVIPAKISECALYLGTVDTCVSEPMLTKIQTVIGATVDTIAVAKSKTQCDSERCVLTKMASQLGEQLVLDEIKTRFKIDGPTDDKLLSNVNIDATLQQWKKVFTDFYAYNFNMLNYASYSYKDGFVYNSPDTLSTIVFADLYYGEQDGNRYRTAACVINTDVYQGGGKHWMALFADTRGPVWTIEFFNSSGNAPAPEWVSWMVKTKTAMEMIIERGGLNVSVELVKVTNYRHQQSRTECGLYSLFYIWARLNGVPHAHFMDTPIPDQFMFEFRQHLFYDKRRQQLNEFDWKKYMSTVNVKWE
jgi:hypothetical protein